MLSVDSRMMNVKSWTSERLKFIAIRLLASSAAMIMPRAGVPRGDRVANTRGNRPSSATASGSWPAIRIQPFSAPKHEMAAPIATRAAARGPASTRAASA